MSLYSFQQIADVLGILKRRVERRAKRNNWLYTEAPARGGMQKRFDLADLPDDVQRALREQNAIAAVNDFAAEDMAREEAERLAEAQRSGEALGEAELARAEAEKNARVKVKEQGLKEFSAMVNGPKKQRARARKWCITALQSYRRDHGGSKSSSRINFVNSFNNGTTTVPELVRDQMPKYNGIIALTVSSLKRWEYDFIDRGIIALVDSYGLNRGRSKIDQNQPLKKIVLGCIFKYPHITPKKIKQYLQAAHADLDIVSIKSIERFIHSWKSDNDQLWTYLTNPDKWKNVYMAAAGSHFERITNLNQLWEMDSTPGDWMLTDGRHSVLGIIDMYSRRLKLFVSKTSKAMAVCQVFRRAALDWGLCDAVRTDNGADYISEQFEHVLGSLEIMHEICIPFASEEKGTIERAMRTMSHGILDLLPGFIGHSVAERKVIEARKSFSARIMTPGDVVEIALSSDELQEKLDQWSNSVYAHDQHSGLDGKSPWQVASEWTLPIRRISDKSALDMLLAEVAGTRTVTKKGIRFDRHHYFHPSLFEYVGKEALIKYDEHDIGRLAVYIEGAFICWAECPSLLGISARESAAASKAHQKKFLSEQAGEYREYKRGLKDNIPDVVLAHRIAQSESLAQFPQHANEHTTPGLNAAADAAASRIRNVTKKRSLTAAERATHKRLQAEINEPATVHELPQDMTQRDRYWLRLRDRVDAGETLEGRDARFYVGYQKTAQYRAFRSVEEDFANQNAGK